MSFLSFNQEFNNQLKIFKYLTFLSGAESIEVRKAAIKINLNSVQSIISLY